MPRRDPFSEMIEQMNDMIHEVTGAQLPSGTDPPVDIEETGETVIVQADLPGLNKDNINLKLRDNSLHIAAETEKELHEEGKDYVRKERSRKRYSRQVRLPVAVDESTASASYEDGVLTVEIDRLESGGGTDIDIE